MSKAVTITGQVNLIQRLKRIRTGMTTLLSDSGVEELLLKRVIKRFDAEVSADGTPWAKPLDSTLARRARKGYTGTKSLNASGSLRRSIGVIQGRADGLFAINSGLGFRIGVTDEDVAKYARIQNNGGISGKPRHKIQARNFLAFNELDVRSMRAKVQRNMANLTKI